ncbi:MAG: glycosyltransferase family 2 protein [Thermomicrobiales bacterium]
MAMQSFPLVREPIGQSYTGLRAVGRSVHSRRIDFVSVVLPCLNEEDAVGATVAEAFLGLRRAGYEGEVIVVDNGSTDRSAERAEAAGAQVIHETVRGYGAAHIAGIEVAQGNVIVMADADCTYDLEHMGNLLAPLADGADMVVGSRLHGTIAKDAMPFTHRYIGTPVITRVLQVLTTTRLSDSQSGYRAFWRQAILDLDLKAPGMEYASEMLLKAARQGLALEEVPSDYRKRVGESKLNTFADGWRHIRMLLLLSPHLTLMLPGFFAMLLGVLLTCTSVFAPVSMAGLHGLSAFLGPILLMLGAQAVILGGIATYRSPLAPRLFRNRVAFLGREGAVNRLMTSFVAAALLGVALDVALTMGQKTLSGLSFLELAGVAQSLIVIGISGLAIVFATDYARESVGL